MMRGFEKTLSNTGCPLPGVAEVTFEQADIVQLGKLYCWGSAAVSFIVRLRDGREVFVRADKQSKEDESFLRHIAKPIRGWAPSHTEDFRTVWGEELTSADASMITLDAVRALSWQDNPSVSEGEGRYQITVEAHPNRDIGTHYLVCLAFGKWSLVKTPDRAMCHVRQRRALAKRR